MFENGSTVCELEPAVTFTILLLYWSATKTAPDVSTAIPNGLFKPVNGRTVGVLDPGSIFTMTASVQTSVPSSWRSIAGRSLCASGRNGKVGQSCISSLRRMNVKLVRPSASARWRSRSVSGESRSSEPEYTYVGGRSV
jgi:hypothetical protein